MNEELQTKLAEVIGSIQGAVTQAGDFAIEQIPDIAAQYLLYGRIYETLSFSVALLILCISLYILLVKGVFNTEAVEPSGFWTDGRITITVGGVFFTALSTCLVMSIADNTIMVWFAPKVWLLREFAGMVK